MVYRGQEGAEKKLDLEERGRLISGGSFSETLDMRETLLISEGPLPPISETPQRAETVVITNA